jgi:hypothetical protein
MLNVNVNININVNVNKERKEKKIIFLHPETFGLEEISM